MSQRIILASGSQIRAQLLRNAGVDFHIQSVRLDEESVRNSLIAESANPRDIADTLAEMKASKISQKEPSGLVIGCDQVLDHRGTLLSKPKSADDAIVQLQKMRNDGHKLLSAVVICENGQPIWRHIGQVRMLMRNVSDRYLVDYVTRNWDSIKDSVGAYKLEEEGVRLFSRVDGDYFTVLGLPLLEVLAFLTHRGNLEQ